MIRGICPFCEKETNLNKIVADDIIKVRGEEYPIFVEYFKCLECDNEFDDPASNYDPLDAAYRKYRAQHGMLQPEEIRELRKSNGLTQKELCTILGLGESTLSRYERGALQEKGHDRLLQLIKNKRNLRELVLKEGLSLGRVRQVELLEELDREIDKSMSFPNFINEKHYKYNPSIQSGFKLFDIDKFFQCIYFFCMSYVFKTKLNKLLFYADFKHFKNHNVSITGARYAHLPHGPVPDKYDYFFSYLVNEENSLIMEEREIGEYTGEVFIAKNAPDFSNFSPSEICTLQEVQAFFKDYSASSVREYSHKEKGYTDTRDGQLISYDYSKQLKI